MLRRDCMYGCTGRRFVVTPCDAANYTRVVSLCPASTIKVYVVMYPWEGCELGRPQSAKAPGTKYCATKYTTLCTCHYHELPSALQ